MIQKLDFNFTDIHDMYTIKRLLRCFVESITKMLPRLNREGRGGRKRGDEGERGEMREKEGR